jgi:hypothetical protein
MLLLSLVVASEKPELTIRLLLSCPRLLLAARDLGVGLRSERLYSQQLGERYRVR